MLRIRGDRQSLITALVSHWLDHTLQLPATPTPSAGKPPLARPAPATER